MKTKLKWTPDAHTTKAPDVIRWSDKARYIRDRIEQRALFRYHRLLTEINKDLPQLRNMYLIPGNGMFGEKEFINSNAYLAAWMVAVRQEVSVGTMLFAWRTTFRNLTRGKWFVELRRGEGGKRKVSLEDILQESEDESGDALPTAVHLNQLSSHPIREYEEEVAYRELFQSIANQLDDRGRQVLRVLCHPPASALVYRENRFDTRANRGDAPGSLRRTPVFKKDLIKYLGMRRGTFFDAVQTIRSVTRKVLQERN